MRSAPHRRLSRAIRRMSAIVSGAIRGGRRRAADRQRQKSRKPSRCQRNTVAGWLSDTIPSATEDMSDTWTGTLKPALDAVWGFINSKILPILTTLANIAIGLVKLEVKALAALWRGSIVSFDTVDLGGGFPWPFGTSDAPVDISTLREKLQSVNAQRRLTAEAELWFESGRYLVASCGTLLSTVLDVKAAHGGKTYIILDTGMVHLGGMAGLGRIYRAVASIEPLAKSNGATIESADVVGPTDYALDFVTRDASVPSLNVGDVVAIPNVGAYGLTASLVAFAGLQPPVEVCCRGSSVIAAHRFRTGHERISI